MACVIFGCVCQEDIEKQETEIPHKRKSKVLPSQTNNGAKEKDARRFALPINSSAIVILKVFVLDKGSSQPLTSMAA